MCITAVFGDANLVAVAKQSEAVQVLLLCPKAIQLLLESVGTSSLGCLCSSCLLHLLGDDVVLQNLLQEEDEFASSLALGCLSGDHELFKLVERYLLGVQETSTYYSNHIDSGHGDKEIRMTCDILARVL